MRKYSSDRKDSFNELRQKRLSIHSKTENKSVEEQFRCHKKQQGNLRQYAQHLEEANRKLHQELDRQRYQSRQEITRLKEKLQAKENLLEDCQREIKNIRKQYKVIQASFQNKQNKIKGDESKYVTPVHGLLRKGLKIDFYE